MIDPLQREIRRGPDEGRETTDAASVGDRQEQPDGERTSCFFSELGFDLPGHGEANGHHHDGGGGVGDPH